MQLKSLLKRASVLGLSAACCLALVGCGGTNYGYTGGVAATVNGVEIKEDTITKYIQDFRTSSELTSNDTWASWMNQNSLDPSTVREQVIDYYVEQELTKQAAEAQGVSVDSADVDAQVESMKSNYSDDDAWKKALETAGITEDQYRESVEQGLLEKNLQEKVISDDQTQVDDATLLSTLNSYSSIFNGAKRSSHILFASGDDSTANDVLNKINSGELDFAEAAKQYSTDTASAANGGDVGWDKINNFVSEYTTALNDLSKDQVSGLVTSDYGIHIIKCTDVFNIDGEATSLDQYPSAIVDYMRDIQKSQNSSTAYSKWLADYKTQADIVINEMPSNVPYNLDMTQYQSDDNSSSDSSGSDNSGTSDSSSASSDGSSTTATTENTEGTEKSENS